MIVSNTKEWIVKHDDIRGHKLSDHLWFMGRYKHCPYCMKNCIIVENKKGRCKKV